MSCQAWIVRALWIATTVGALALVVLVASLMAVVDGGPGTTVIFVVLGVDAVAFASMAVLRVALVLASAGPLIVLAFCGLVVGLQAILTPVTEESTLAVATSTLVAFALFQPDPGVTVESALSPDTSVPWIRRRATAR